jgi:hypothetical protein
MYLLTSFYELLAKGGSLKRIEWLFSCLVLFKSGCYSDSFFSKRFTKQTEQAEVVKPQRLYKIAKSGLLQFIGLNSDEVVSFNRSLRQEY